MGRPEFGKATEQVRPVAQKPHVRLLWGISSTTTGNCHEKVGLRIDLNYKPGWP